MRPLLPLFALALTPACFTRYHRANELADAREGRRILAPLGPLPLSTSAR